MFIENYFRCVFILIIKSVCYFVDRKMKNYFYDIVLFWNEFLFKGVNKICIYKKNLLNLL